ncbi:MAG: DUF3110 domain-containing protein [Spirulinaceae cyanobacterium]
MFEQFSEAAIKVFMIAHDESSRLGHDFIGTEMILVGLAGETNGMASHFLSAIGLDFNTACSEVNSIIGQRCGKTASKISFTPSAQRVLELSLELSNQLKSECICTEHLLLGLLQVNDNVISGIINKFVIDSQKFYEKLFLLSKKVFVIILDIGTEDEGYYTVTKDIEDEYLVSFESREDAEKCANSVREKLLWKASVQCLSRYDIEALSYIRECGVEFISEGEYGTQINDISSMVIVLYFYPGTKEQEFYFLEIGRNLVILMFEARKDAVDYCNTLEAKGLSKPSVEVCTKSNIEIGCKECGFISRFIPKGETDFLDEYLESIIFVIHQKCASGDKEHLVLMHEGHFMILMFECRKDAIGYCQDIKERDSAEISIESCNRKDIEKICKNSGVLAKFISSREGLENIPKTISSNPQADLDEVVDFTFIDQLLIDFMKRPSKELLHSRLNKNINEINLYFVNKLEIALDFLFRSLAKEKKHNVAIHLFSMGRWMSEFPCKKSDFLEASIVAYKASQKVLDFNDDLDNLLHVKLYLANAYFNRSRGNREESIEQSIEIFRSVLGFSRFRENPSIWFDAKNGLAGALSQRIKGEKRENMEKAIASYEDILKAVNRNDYLEQWAMIQHNLGNAYSDRIKGDRASNIEKAITAHTLALEATSRENFPEEWAGTLRALACDYSIRIKQSKSDNLERAIKLFETVFEICKRSEHPQGWAITQFNLANVFRNRIQGERASNIEKAITSYKLALEVFSLRDFPEKWASIQSGLASAYLIRIRGDREENIELSIRLHDLSLKVFTQKEYPIDWAKSQANLSLSYKERITGNRIENNQKALESANNSLKVLNHDGFPDDWAEIQNILSILYRRPLQEKISNNLSRAITAAKNAMSVFTFDSFPEKWAGVQYNLAATYLELDRRQNKEDNLEKAIHYCEQALTVYTPDQFPRQCRSASQTLARIYAKKKQAWQESLHPYKLAIAATENLYQSSISRTGEEAELKAIRSLYHEACYAHAKANKFQKSALLLEQIRARDLTKRLQTSNISLDAIKHKISPSLFNRYESLIQSLRYLDSTERSDSTVPKLQLQFSADQAIKVRTEFKDCVAEIRKILGHGILLDTPTFTDITQSLQPNRPLIYLTTTPSGSLALILTPTDTRPAISSVWLDDLNETQLRELLVAWFEANENNKAIYAQYRQNPNPATEQAFLEAEEKWYQAIDDGTRQLWDQVMQPIVDHLETHQITQATLIPTGYLSLLPLHAAWTEAPNNTKTGRRYACDTICFTTAPNARSLQTAQTIAQNTPITNLLAIDNPTQDLPSSAAEVATATSTFPDAFTFSHARATRQAVLAAIPHHSVLHFSCHGYANFSEPLKSGLVMAYKEILSLSDLFDLKLDGIRLAILSACETGLPGTALPDEVVSLPTGLLQAGVAGVVASLWSVSDLSTMLLLTRFYDFWRNDNLEPAAALHQAQLWLRDTTSYEKAAFFQKSHPELIMKLAPLEPDYFAHPYHWAAFTYTGV